MGGRERNLAAVALLAAALIPSASVFSAGAALADRERGPEGRAVAIRDNLAAVRGASRFAESAALARKIRRIARGPGIIVVEEGPSFPITVQIQQTGAPEEKKKAAEPAKKKVYVPPRWVETEHGVLVLEHGRWVEMESEREY